MQFQDNVDIGRLQSESDTRQGGCHSPTGPQLNPIGCHPQVGKEKELVTSFYNVSALINPKKNVLTIFMIFATTC
jgi:hypothetical protein